jgi:hypothetical protein
MNNARKMDPPASLITNGFSLFYHPIPSDMKDFNDRN